MTLAWRPAATIFAVAISAATPAAADEPMSVDLAISRLRACATAGAGGAPRDSVQAAVVAIRVLCRPQIDRAYQASDRQVAALHPGASAEELADLHQQAHRRIDYDLALLISRSTGLQP